MFLYIKKNKHTSILQNSNSKISEYDENVYKNCHMIQFDSEILKRNWKVVSNPILPKNTLQQINHMMLTVVSDPVLSKNTRQTLNTMPSSTIAE